LRLDDAGRDTPSGHTVMNESAVGSAAVTLRRWPNPGRRDAAAARDGKHQRLPGQRAAIPPVPSRVSSSRDGARACSSGWRRLVGRAGAAVAIRPGELSAPLYEDLGVHHDPRIGAAA